MDNNLLMILFAVIIFVGLLMLVIIGTTVRRSHKLDKADYQERMEKIERLVAGNGIAASHMAIIEADKLLDKALKERGIKGNTMGDRLKNGRSLLTHEDRIWAAHKLRNRIAHDDNVSLDAAMAKKAIAVFKAALRDVGAL